MKLLGVLALVALAATRASAQMYVIEIGVTQDGQEQPLGESQVRKASLFSALFLDISSCSHDAIGMQDLRCKYR